MTQTLAIHGGPPAVPEGPPAWPIADQAVLQALESAYADGSWGKYHGSHCERLAARLAEMHGVEHVMLCSSGTFAVELALRALNVGDGDEVILAGYDFSGNFRCIEAVGARPVLVDVDPKTWCADAAEIERAIDQVPAARAIIVSHLHGGTAAMRQIVELATHRGLAVVEDACQSPGASIDGQTAGSWGDVGVLSFGGSKLLTAGRGGAILTRRADAAQRAKVFCERGNHAFPLSELQAAVLLPQLDKLDERNAVRLRNAARLRDCCRKVDALRPVSCSAADDQPSYYKFAWLYDPDQCGGHRREDFIAAVQAEGVAIDAGFRGFIRRSERRCHKIGSLTHSSRAAENTVLLQHPVLLEPAEVIGRVATAVHKVASGL